MKSIAFWENRLLLHVNEVVNLTAWIKNHGEQRTLPRRISSKRRALWMKSIRQQHHQIQKMAKHEAHAAYCRERIEALRKLTHWDHLRKGLGVCG